MIERENSIFIAIDFQERLLPAMAHKDWVKAQSIKLINGIKLLGLPMLATTQYAKGIGETEIDILEALGDTRVIDKRTFSVFGCEEFCEAFEETAEGRNTAVVCGIETHICLQQSCLDLIERGYEVYIPADCVDSRSEFDRDMALRRLEKAGCIITTYESVLYELTRDSRLPEFKGIVKIVK